MSKKLLGEVELNRIYQRDCIEGMRLIPNDSVDLIVIDPPYNIGKDKRWDKWKTVDAYVAFMLEVSKECERVLKPNGSFYWFHNDMEQVARLMREIAEETPFIFKQMITWNKRFDSARNKGFLDGFVEVGGLRNYQKMAEYCLFYTFQDENEDNKLFIHAVSEIQDYVRTLIYKYGGNVTKANEFYCAYSGKTGNYRGLFFGKSQPILYTEQQYGGLCAYISSLGCEEDLKTYEEILVMCDRDTFLKNRYTYNNQKTHHSVWNYEIAHKQGHVTPKPLELIENIIRHSSNEGDVVLDCFMGSGTTAVAAVRLKRNFIGFEREPEYIEIANKRLDGETEVSG